MQVRKDMYNLNQSSIINISNKGIAINLNLKLNSNTKPINVNSSISGLIIDSLGNPIPNAIIKLMDDKLQPLLYSYTDNKGKYLIENIPTTSAYNIAATAPSKLLTFNPQFTLNQGMNKVINFTLLNDPNVSLSDISGNVSANNSPVFGAVVFLYSFANNTNTLVAITYTDTFGDFIFGQLNGGNYNIKVSALGQNPYEEVITLIGGQIKTLNINLTSALTSATGIISGVVTDSANSPVAAADVVLYSISSQNVLSPVAYTTTNSTGVYAFNNVPLGNYVVKSNQSEIINIP